MEKEIITYEVVLEKFKNKPIIEWTDQDVFDICIGYGDSDELNNSTIQELLINHGYINELINLADKTICDEKIINKILNSKILKEQNYNIKEGSIYSIEFKENEDLPNDFFDVCIYLKNNISTIVEIKDICYKPDKDEYVQDIQKYKEKIIFITEEKNNIIKKICALKG